MIWWTNKRGRERCASPGLGKTNRTGRSRRRNVCSHWIGWRQKKKYRCWIRSNSRNKWIEKENLPKNTEQPFAQWICPWVCVNSIKMRISLRFAAAKTEASSIKSTTSRIRTRTTKTTQPPLKLILLLQSGKRQKRENTSSCPFAVSTTRTVLTVFSEFSYDLTCLSVSVTKSA